MMNRFEQSDPQQRAYGVSQTISRSPRVNQAGRKSFSRKKQVSTPYADIHYGVGKRIAWSTYPQLEIPSGSWTARRGIPNEGWQLLLPTEFTLQVKHVELNTEVGPERTCEAYRTSACTIAFTSAYNSICHINTCFIECSLMPWNWLRSLTLRRTIVVGANRGRLAHDAPGNPDPDQNQNDIA